MFQGTESEICVPTNMLNEEIYLTFLAFFYKIAVNKSKPKELKVNIVCPDEIHSEPLILLHSDVNYAEMKEKLTSVLLKAFQVYIKDFTISSAKTFVVIEENGVTSCVERIQSFCNNR